MNQVLGRTNAVFPKVWLNLLMQNDAKEGWPFELVSAALDANTVIDISSQPLLWGGQMRGTDAKIMAVSGKEISNATSSDHAGDLLQARLLQTLSSLGRESLDFYFLDYRRAWEEHQINGALETLEYAKQEGAIKFFGLFAGGSSLAALGMWQFHDAFDVILCPNNPLQRDGYKTLAPLAQERRVGIVGCSSLNWGGEKPIPDYADQLGLSPNELAQVAIRVASEHHPVLVGVRSPEEITTAMQSGSVQPGDEEVLERVRQIVVV